MMPSLLKLSQLRERQYGEAWLSSVILTGELLDREKWLQLENCPTFSKSIKKEEKGDIHV